MTLARLLDAGAWGLIVPHVSSARQARELAAAMRYPPVGVRSAGTGRCVTMARNYIEVANDEILFIPQIEDLEGIENAEAIANVEGVDIGFLGPNDLARSMGVPMGHPEHEAALQRFREGCKRAGKPSGIPENNISTVRRRIEEGFQFIDFGNDLRFLEATVNSGLSELFN